MIWAGLAASLSFRGDAELRGWQRRLDTRQERQDDSDLILFHMMQGNEWK